jgi:DNA sulfur modification protein DndD
MKLKMLRVSNFRQFYGDQPALRFPDSKQKNVTLIIGANGAGKTAILNAFTWLLYEKTTPAFAKPDFLVSERALAEAKVGTDVEAKITLEFEHEDRQYLATRIQSVSKTANPIGHTIVQEGLLSLAITDEVGNTRYSENPQETLSGLLPERLHSFFFFDGERIERLSKESAYAEVGEAIRNLLGLELLERALKHLRSEVKRKLDSELAAYGTNELRLLIEDIAKKEDKLTKLGEDRKSLGANLAALEGDIGDLKDRLRGLEQTRDLQGNLDRREAQEESTKAAIVEADQKIRELISSQGFTAFLLPSVEKASKVLAEKRKKGEIPSGIKKQFVEDLLDAGTCICGVSLKKGDAHHKSVSSWLARAGLDDVEEAATKVGLQFQSYVRQRENFFSALRSLLDKRKRDRDILHEVRESISELQAKLGEVGRRQAETVKDLIDKQQRLVDQLSETKVKIGAADNELNRLRSEVEGLEKQKNEAQARDQKAQLVQKRLRVCAEAISFFDKLYTLRSAEVRAELDDRIKKVYTAISYKDYQPEVTADYHLVLKKGLRGGEGQISLDVAKSTGENQILSLAFIGSVVDYARERHLAYLKDPNKEGLGFTGGLYPMVMDSPFGALDLNYQKSVAEGVPKLADQVVILASRSQAMGAVFDALRSRLHGTYVLSYSTPKGDASAETLDLLGKKFPYVTRSKNDYEWAEILEVR